MAKAYWIAFYKSIKDQEKFAGYAKLAPAAIQAFGGKFLVRGMPAKTYLYCVKYSAIMAKLSCYQRKSPWEVQWSCGLRGMPR